MLIMIFFLLLGDNAMFARDFNDCIKLHGAKAAYEKYLGLDSVFYRKNCVGDTEFISGREKFISRWSHSQTKLDRTSGHTEFIGSDLATERGVYSIYAGSTYGLTLIERGEYYTTWIKTHKGRWFIAIDLYVAGEVRK